MDQVDLVFICNPNNPTGRLLDGKTVEYILDKAFQQGVMVLVDEAFRTSSRKRTFSVMKRVGISQISPILYSLTKFSAYPACDSGAIAASVKLIRRMNAAKDPWNVNVLAQVAGAAGLRDHDYMERTVRLVRQGKNNFSSAN